MNGEPRRPAVAGTFYPAEPQVLRPFVDGLLEDAAHSRAAVATAPTPAGDLAAGPEPTAAAPAPASAPAPAPQIIGLLVPHAGLAFSGAIAALAWSVAGEIAPATIVLAGTDHQASSAGVGVWTGGPWRTPIGDAAIDSQLASAVAALGPPFLPDGDAHLAEHSLEVQVPLILRACPDSRIVPLAVSPRLRDHAEAGARLGALLAARRAAGERIVLVISTDFAHYPPHTVCQAVTRELLEPLLRLDSGALRRRERAVVSAYGPGIVCGMCGIDPARVGLAALAEMGATGGVLLGSATSADAGGDRRRTVGYAAAAFS
jgi:MEMO1 family protein